MKVLTDILEFLQNNPYIAIFGATCLIEIAPIKINPWSKLFKWIGKQLNGELESKVMELDKKVDELTTDVSDERVQNKRWSVLNFTNTCRQGVLHTKEEWDHTLDEVKWYEEYCKNNKVRNGVIEESVSWLRCRYREHMDNDDFLKD